MPHRGVLPELIGMRPNDTFVLVLRKSPLEEHMRRLFEQLEKFTNWTLVYEKLSRRFVNFLALLNYKNHVALHVKGDVYLTFDAEYLGTNNRPLIITLHDLSSVRTGSTSSISPMKKIARKFTIENAVKNADAIVTISEFTENDAKDYFENKALPITVIKNGIGNEWFDQNRFCNENEISEENYWIWWGGFSERKNLERLLLAYEQFCNEHENECSNLKLVGAKNLHFQKLLSIVENSVILRKKVKFLPQKNIDELICLVRASKGLLFPSLYEGFGLPVIEAYSQGVPVLASNVSSLPEIAGEYGVFVNPLKIESIQEGMEKLNVLDVDKKDFMSYASEFTYKKAAQNYSELIDNVSKSSK